MERNISPWVLGLIFLPFFYGCSSPKTLNLKGKSFDVPPTKIVWFQIAGFSEEHLSLLKYAGSQANRKLSFENGHCFGKAWRYNIFKLRPNAFESFMSQMTGRRNFKSNCEDFRVKPFWLYMEGEKKDVGIFERGLAKFSFPNLNSCDDEGQTFYQKKARYWFSLRRPLRKNEQTFHYLENTPFSKKGVYYDRSCHKKYCDSGFVGNIKSIYERWAKNKESFIFIIRDFKYLSELKKKNILKIKRMLFDLEEIYSFFLDKLGKQDDLLVLLTGASPSKFEYPLSGRSWFDFEKKGKNILYRRPSLMSPIIASGASAENFCGLYHESEVFKRLLWRSSAGKLIE